MAIMIDTPNPLTPATSPSAADLMNAYQAHAAQIRGETQAQTSNTDYNPYAPVEDNQQDAQQAHISAMEQALAPVPMNQYDIADHNTPENAAIFAKHIEHDPAFKEFGDDFTNTLETLRQSMMNGQIDINQARQIVAGFGQEVIDPALEKHHGSHSPTHKIGLLDKDHGEALARGAK